MNLKLKCYEYKNQNLSDRLLKNFMHRYYQNGMTDIQLALY